MSNRWRIGFDIGGTFTDFILYDSQERSVRLHKRLTEMGVTHAYEEFPDDHTAVDYRMDISLPILAKALSK